MQDVLKRMALFCKAAVEVTVDLVFVFQWSTRFNQT